MWNFIKNVFAVLTGLVLFSIGSVVVFIIVIALVLNSSQSKEQLKANSVLKIKLDKEIVERENEDLLPNVRVFQSPAAIGLIELKQAIALAAENDDVRGIYLELSSVRAGFASLEEIRNALLDFKNSGKFVVAYGEAYSEGAYYLASVADKIILPPTGALELNGLESELVFFKGTLEKLDIEVEVFKVGTFKSAVEPFILDKMSDANRTQLRSFMNSIYDTYLSNVAVSRKIEKEKLKLISDSMLVRNAADALEYKLITDLDYYQEVENYIRSNVSTKEDEKINFVSYKKLLQDTKEEGAKDKKNIAVIIANGDIVSGKGNEDRIGSESLSAQIRKAREDKDIKAVVLRINSPGGSALASDVIWNEVLQTRKVKPVIASMSDVAASGGYYIAMGCDAIVAQPNTITGSIGVFGLMLNTEAFLQNKLGITTDREKTGAYADLGSSTRSLTDHERAIIQQEVDRIYEDFTSKAADGRNMSQDALKEYAEGRVWSGTEALRIKLVDTLGGLQTAIELAALKAGLEEEPQIEYLPKQKSSILKDFFDGMGEGEEETQALLQKELGIIYPYVKTIKDLDKLNGVQARVPYRLIVR
jgi:protease-4